jgi:hypothetical protein
MKYILLLLLAVTATAQTVTEKDLLGGWKLSTASMNGVLINFETGKATPLKGFEGTYTADDLKKLENGIKGPHPFPTSVIFTGGGNMEDVVEGITENVTFTLEDKGGKTFMGDGRDNFELRLQGGVLSFVYAEEDGEIVISFRKQ